MASNLLKQNLFLLLLVVMTSLIAQASDLDILSDFVAPLNISSTDGNYFTFMGMRDIFQYEFLHNLKVTKASLVEFPALNGQSVSLAVLQFPAGSINPPHINSRSTGILFVLEGSLEVGFIDTTNKLFTQKLQLGDTFMFPRGLVHYQYNADPEKPAIAVAAFGCANVGTFFVPATVFVTGIDNAILAKSFKTDVASVQKIKRGLVTKA